MNTTKRQSARPGDYGSKGANVVPPEARAMARQLGLAPEDMAKADEFWLKLNTMAESDPAGYADIMHVSGKAMRKAQGEDVEEEDPETREAEERVVRRFLGDTTITPVAGFVVKAFGTRGKVMVNCCAHRAIAPPTDAGGREVPADDARGWNAQGLSIPMVVGEPRSCLISAASKVGDGLAVDVIFNPWVLDHASVETVFKQEVADLAVNWAAQERPALGLGTNANSNNNNNKASFKVINSRYKGGLGDRSDEPVPFDIDVAEAQSRAPSDRPARPNRKASEGDQVGVTATPASLLDRLRTDQAEEAADSLLTDLKITREKEAKAPSFNGAAGNDDDMAPGQQQKKKRKKKKPIIEVVELGADGFDISSEAAPPQERMTAPRDNNKAAVKKGFLSDSAANKAIYPRTGSEQGEKEGVYSRFMSKCTVVDTSAMTPEDQQRVMREHAGVPKGGPAVTKNPPPATEGATRAAATTTTTPHKPAVKKGFLAEGGASIYDAKGSREGAAVSSFDSDFEDLLKVADPEYAAAVDSAKKPGVGEGDDGIAQLTDFANKLNFQEMYGDFGRPMKKTPFGEKKKKLTEDAATQEEEAEAVPEATKPAVDEGGFKRGFFGDDPEKEKKKTASALGRGPPPSMTHTLADLDPAADGKRRVLVTATVEGALTFSDVTLDVAVDAVSVTAKKLNYNLKLPLPFDVDPNKTAAKFSKKKQLLSVTLIQK